MWYDCSYLSQSTDEETNLFNITSIFDFQSKCPFWEKIIIQLTAMATLIFTITTAVLLLTIVLAKKGVINREKRSPFECGFDRNSNFRVPFSLRFFLITIVFLIFDVEVVLLLPSIVAVTSSSMTTWVYVFFFFILILLFGLFHEWKQGALNWTI